MEWVETTAKTIEAAREAALDQLGVAADDAEFEIVEEPRPGLFGRVRGEARVRARVRPTPVRPKQDRRRRSKSDRSATTGDTDHGDPTAVPAEVVDADVVDSSPDVSVDEVTDAPPTAGPDGDAVSTERSDGRGRRRSTPRTSSQETPMSTDDRPESTVTPDEVGAAAVAFMRGLTDAFGADADVAVVVDDLELDVSVTGSELGLLVGPGGRTLNAIQDLARVAAQRKLGDHETRLRVDVAGYRERREAALASFARDVAQQVIESGTPRSLEPMTSADRKIVHDVLNEIDGVTTRSVGDDPQRRIVIDPA
jgi:spoIIIJ-associated protein